MPPVLRTPPPPEQWVTPDCLGRFPFDAARVRTAWTALHAGQPLPPPATEALADAWALYHAGDFAAAAQAGQRIGGALGAALADQATAIYANYVEPDDERRLALLRQVGERALARHEADGADVQALYWHAYALGRHAQAVSVARALAQGLGGRLKDTLERIIQLQPGHADAHFALGAFHAEVIDKVGELVARMTYGVRAERAIELFERGLALHPASATGRVEYARALVALRGDPTLAQVQQLYEDAAAVEPLDARQFLDREVALACMAD
ncbi:MAG: hypothetical protein J7603_13900 [Pseudacidovorax sp.]|nr:hypothetical protein [Pseudacidovorax sp.]